MAVYVQAQCIRKSICELCDKDSKVDFKCVNCQQILCFDCKNVHLRSKASMDHEINPVNTINTGQSKSNDFNMTERTQGQNGYHHDTANNLCHLHPKRMALLFCKDCSEVS